MKKAIKWIGTISIILLIGLSIGSEVADARGKTKKKECRYTRTCNYTIQVDGVNYRVTGGAHYYRTCGENSWPSWGCNLIRSEIIDRINPGNLSMSWGLSCGNTHFYSATILSSPGVCGSSNGGTFTEFPTDNLCTMGTATATSSSPSGFNWTCAGTNGGTDASCSASTQTSFDLSCSAIPYTGIVNQIVDFDATISNSMYAESEYTFSWNVNGVTYSDDDTFQYTFPTATNTAQVKVTAQYGSEAKEIICPFNRVDCDNGNYYCGDMPSPVSYSCVSGPENCPNSQCGVGYDISQDKELAAGGTLPTSDPGSSFLETNGLCAAGNELKYVNGVSSWLFSSGYSTWQWSCKHPEVVSTANCKARCKTGEYYCMSQGACIPDTQACDCPLNGGGGMVDQRLYCIDDRNNQCYACGQVVKYFKLLPDEIQKDQGQSCGAYWETNPVAEENKPENTTDTRVVCNMNTGRTTSSVGANNPEGGSAYPLGIASHELVCTQQYQLNNEPEWFDLLSSTMTAKCRALPGVIER